MTDMLPATERPHNARRRAPDWPYRMKADLAAAYCDCSETKFHTEVEKGTYPKGVRDGGNVYWYRDELEDAMDTVRRRARHSDPSAPSAQQDEFSAGVHRAARQAQARP